MKGGLQLQGRSPQRAVERGGTRDIEYIELARSRAPYFRRKGACV